MPSIEQARAWYLDEDQVHDFDHILRVYRLAEAIAEREGADAEIVCAAVLLHDAGLDSGNAARRRDHHESAAQFAGEILSGEGWPEERINAVQACILTHRYRAGTEPDSIEAKVVFDADKLDAIGAIGVARALAFAVRHDQPLYAEPSETFMTSLQTEPGEPYTAYHEYLFKLSKIKDRLQTASGKALAVERDRFQSTYFEQLRAEAAGEK